MISPLKLEMLLHYYSRPTDYRDGDFEAPAVGDAIEFFIEEQILERADRNVDRARTLKLTEKGVFYIGRVLNTPLPEIVYVIPKLKRKITCQNLKKTYNILMYT